MHAHDPGRHERLDGNAAGGRLIELFGRDMTGARAACAHCGLEGPLANTIAELDDAGMILLCRGCGRTLLTVVRSAGVQTLDIAGLRRLQWPL